MAKSLLLLAVIAAAAALFAGLLAPSGEATTKAGLVRRIDVTLTDSSVSIERNRWKRGTVAHFQVVNKGTKPHNFVVGGFWRSRVLRPGERQMLAAVLDIRGNYLYRSTLDCGASTRGVLVVF
jgi:hypothetical protein